jgi:putative flavoprotein involved in K+ transport
VVIFTSGFRPDYGRWIRFPAFDAMGFPLTDDGASTVVPGLFFCGVHFLRKRKSSVLFGVGEDAAIVAQSVARGRPASLSGVGGVRPAWRPGPQISILESER